jgi:hypothetical protein
MCDLLKYCLISLGTEEVIDDALLITKFKELASWLPKRSKCIAYLPSTSFGGEI